MNIKLTIDDIELPIGVELAASIASNLNNSPKNQKIFHKLAQHNSASVRKEIAYKDTLSNETTKILLRDKDMSVLEYIVRSDSAKEILDMDDFNYIISTNSEAVIENLISYIDDYVLLEDDLFECLNKILELNNDYLTMQIASNYNTPKKILKELLKSDDPDVVFNAKKSLE
jgi:hypothetical protein